jgi:hypothetical protein
VKNLESVIITHVKDEGTMFSGGVSDDATFNKVIQDAFGDSKSVQEAILKQFPSPAATNSKYKTQKERFGAYMASSVFSCYTRYLTEAYSGKAYNVQFSHGSGQHGTDLTALFPGEGYFTPLSLMYGSSNKGPKDFLPKYRAYLSSHVRAGNPNTFKSPGTIEWPLVKLGPVLSQVLNVGDDKFTLIDDLENTTEQCSGWLDIYAAVTAAKGKLNAIELVRIKDTTNSNSRTRSPRHYTTQVQPFRKESATDPLIKFR